MFYRIFLKFKTRLFNKFQLYFFAFKKYGRLIYGNDIHFPGLLFLLFHFREYYIEKV